MTCSNCGTANTPESRFCASCGTRLAADVPSTEPATSPWPSAPASTAAPGSSARDPAPPTSTPWGPPPAANPYAAGPGSTAPPPYGAPPPPYGAPPTGFNQLPPYPGAYGPTRSTNGLAVASLVLGIVGGVLCGIGSILAIVFGFIARGQIRASQGRQTGEGLATAGIILGFLWVIGIVLLVIISAASGNHSTRYCTYPNC